MALVLRKMRVEISRDTYIDKSYPSQSFGSSTTLKFGGPIEVQNGNEVRPARKACLWWTPTLPAHKNVVSAALKVYVQQMTNEDPDGFWGISHVASFADSDTWNTAGQRWLYTSEVRGIWAPAESGNWRTIGMALSSATNPSYDRGWAVLVSPRSALLGGISGEATITSIEGGANRPYVELSYYDIEPLAPTNLSPSSGTKQEHEAIRFSWRHNHPTEQFQAGYQIEYQPNLGTVRTVTGTSAQQFHDFASMAFAPGVCRWRVRTLSDPDTYGPWSSYAEFEVLRSYPNAPTGLSPANINKDLQETMRFSWTYSSPSNDTQRGYGLEYAVNGGAVQTLSATTPNTYRDFAANTFAEGSVTWRVRVQDQGQDWSAWSEWATFSTIRGIPFAPTNLSPNADYKDLINVIRFSWQHNHPFGEVQYKFDLEWSDTVTPTQSITQQVANTYRDFAANTFAPGSVTWRVRTYNRWNQAGAWSAYASFFAVGAPAKAVITSVTDSSLPTITWTSVGQQVWQLQILSGSTVVYDTGYQPGTTIRQHTVSSFLSPGIYTVQVRIKNEFDIESEWAYFAFEITPKTEIAPATIEISNITNGLQLRFHGLDGRGVYHVLYRALAGGSFIPIARLDPFTEIYNEYATEHGIEYSYILRSVATSGAFADSAQASGTASIRYYAFAATDALGNIFEFKKALGNFPEVSDSRENQYVEQYFAGRELPVAEYTGRITRPQRFKFFLREKSARDAFEEIYNKKGVTLYRSPRRRRAFGILTGLAISDTIMGYDVSFSLTEVDFSEAVSEV